MNSPTPTPSPDTQTDGTAVTAVTAAITSLCRGDRQLLESWLTNRPLDSIMFCLPAILIGCGLYGFTMGLWQGWEMATYVGIKLPLVVFATLLVNGMINGMLAMVLGSGIGFRQSIQFLLAGFALMSIILAALSPVSFYMALSVPPPESANAAQSHSIILLAHTLLIAYAGIISHRSLLAHVRQFATTPAHGTRTFFAWLAGNLFVGAQISWIMRPFFGSPGLHVQFLRDHPMAGNFYETILFAIQTLFSN